MIISWLPLTVFLPPIPPAKVHFLFFPRSIQKIERESQVKPKFFNLENFFFSFKNPNIKMTWKSSREYTYHEPKVQGKIIQSQDPQKLNVQIFSIFPLVSRTPHQEIILLFNLIIFCQVCIRIIKPLFLPLDIIHVIRHFHAWVFVQCLRVKKNVICVSYPLNFCEHTEEHLK